MVPLSLFLACGVLWLYGNKQFRSDCCYCPREAVWFTALQTYHTCLPCVIKHKTTHLKPCQALTAEGKNDLSYRFDSCPLMESLLPETLHGGVTEGPQEECLPFSRADVTAHSG